MKEYRTAAFTAVWRKMGKVDDLSIKQVPFFQKIVGYILGFLDKASVDTISKRTLAIDSLIKKTNPKVIVEIGCGYSSRAERFSKIKIYELDLEHIAKRNKNSVFDIRKDSLDLNLKNALFIVEGVTMYFHKDEVIKLLKEIKKYNGILAIDFFNKENSRIEKTLNEKIYKFIFKKAVGKTHLFDFRIENVEDGKNILKDAGFKNIKYIDNKLKRTLDCLFYSEF
ncbi:MAG TPA: hypothetical protein VI564_04830 [Candidatus Nanoarchaeia archaeon]|nr:hypothetical protein [Candidatus Nanoarchaeia archaeon]